MPKTKDAFALRFIILSDELFAQSKEYKRQGDKDSAFVAAYEAGEIINNFFEGDKKFYENKRVIIPFLLYEVSDEYYEPDLIKRVEKSIRRFEFGIERTKFLLSRFDVHDERLKRILATGNRDESFIRRGNELLAFYAKARDYAKVAIENFEDFKSQYLQMLKLDYNRELGRRLRICRRRKNLTQQFVAEYLNVSKSSYCGYELGRCEISPLYIYQLSKLFETTPDYLLGYKNR